MWSVLEFSLVKHLQFCPLTKIFYMCYSLIRRIVSEYLFDSQV